MIGGAEDLRTQEMEARLERQDLCDLLNTGQGYRCWLRLVTALGAGQTITATEEQVTMHNLAEQLLRQAAEANPDAYLRMMGQIMGINTNTGETDGRTDGNDDGGSPGAESAGE